MFQTDGLRTIYQCTWPSCTHRETQSRQEIETHVRHKHLGLQGPPGDDEDGEEEFYYTEFELPPLGGDSEYADLTSDSPVSSGGRSGHSRSGSSGLNVPELRTPVPCEQEEDCMDDQDDVEKEDCCLVVADDGGLQAVPGSSLHQAVAGSTTPAGLNLVKAPISYNTNTTSSASPSSSPSSLPSYSLYNNIMTNTRPVGALFPQQPHLAKIPMGAAVAAANNGAAVVSSANFYAVPAQPQVISNQQQHHLTSMQPQRVVQASMQPQPLLADHFDMARPPHENPEYSQQQGTVTLTSIIKLKFLN